MNPGFIMFLQMKSWKEYSHIMSYFITYYQLLLSFSLPWLSRPGDIYNLFHTTLKLSHFAFFFVAFHLKFHKVPPFLLSVKIIITLVFLILFIKILAISNVAQNLS